MFFCLDFFLIFTDEKLRHCCRKFGWPVYDGCRLNFLKHTASENTFKAHLSSNSKVIVVVDMQHFLKFKSHDFKSGSEGCIKLVNFGNFLLHWKTVADAGVDSSSTWAAYSYLNGSTIFCFVHYPCDKWRIWSYSTQPPHHGDAFDWSLEQARSLPVRTKVWPCI